MAMAPPKCGKRAGTMVGVMPETVTEVAPEWRGEPPEAEVPDELTEEVLWGYGNH